MACAGDVADVKKIKRYSLSKMLICQAVVKWFGTGIKFPSVNKNN